MIYLVYLVIVAASVNIAIGSILLARRELNLKIRQICYVNVLVQLLAVCLILIFGGQVSYLLKLIMLGLFLIGYFLSARAPFLRFVRPQDGGEGD